MGEQGCNMLAWHAIVSPCCVSQAMVVSYVARSLET